MEALKTHYLADADPANIVIISDDTLLAHCCGAIIKKFYNHLGKDSSKIKFYYVPDPSTSIFENMTHVIRIDYRTKGDISTYLTKSKDISVIDIYNKSQYKNTPQAVDNVSIFSEDFRLCETLWNYLFSNTCLENVPNCVSYIDNYVADAHCSERSAHFYMGMCLMETRADTSYDFWEALFDSRENLPPNASDEEVMERMKWDTMLQVTNMGAVVETYNAIVTEEACKHALVHERISFFNTRDYVPRVLFQCTPDATFVVTFYVVGTDTEQGYECEYTVLTEKENASALVFASKFGGSGTRTKATFTSTLTPKEIWEQLSCKPM